MNRQAMYDRKNAYRRGKLLARKALLPADILPGENWLPVAGFEGRYEVSDKGRVRSLPGDKRHGIVLSNSLDRCGYRFVRLHGAARQVHHLVCEAFNGPRNGAVLCRHLDDEKANNTPSNLAWGTKSENALDAIRNGRFVPRAKLSPPQVADIRAREARPLLHRDLAAEFGVSPATITRLRPPTLKRTLSGQVVRR